MGPDGSSSRLKLPTPSPYSVIAIIFKSLLRVSLWSILIISLNTTLYPSSVIFFQGPHQPLYTFPFSASQPYHQIPERFKTILGKYINHESAHYAIYTIILFLPTSQARNISYMKLRNCWQDENFEVKWPKNNVDRISCIFKYSGVLILFN